MRIELGTALVAATRFPGFDEFCSGATTHEILPCLEMTYFYTEKPGDFVLPETISAINGRVLELRSRQTV